MTGLYGAFLAAGSMREKSEPRMSVIGNTERRSVSREVGTSGYEGRVGCERIEDVAGLLSALDLAAPFRRVGADNAMVMLMRD